MDATDQLLLICTRQELTPALQARAQALACAGEIDWPRLLATATAHGVVPLVYAHLAQFSKDWQVPEAALAEGKAHASRNALDKKQRSDHLAAALTYFATLGLRAMLIKGAAMDLLIYDQPWFTISSDTDIILSAALEELPDERLREIMATLHRKRIEYDFYRHHDVDMNGALPVDFEEIWRDSHPGEFQGLPIALMSPEDQLISLCVNCCRKRYFRLKSLLDISESLARLPGLDWKRLLDKARRYDCQLIVYTALQVCELMLACPLPDYLLDGLEVPEWRRRLIRALITALSRRTPLAGFQSEGQSVLGRRLHPALLLTYASYRPYQARKKMNEVVWTWLRRRDPAR